MENCVFLVLLCISACFAAVMPDSVPVLIWSNERCSTPYSLRDV